MNTPWRLSPQSLMRQFSRLLAVLNFVALARASNHAMLRPLVLPLSIIGLCWKMTVKSLTVFSYGTCGTVASSHLLMCELRVLWFAGMEASVSGGGSAIQRNTLAPGAWRTTSWWSLPLLSVLFFFCLLGRLRSSFFILGRF